MNRSTDYTYSNLLIEEHARIDAEYKHDLKMACWLFPLVVAVSILILAL